MSSNYRILCGDCLEALDTLEPNSIDCIITDPPYGLTSITKRFGKENSAPNQYGKDGSFARPTKGFMGKEWDGSGIEYNVEMWQKCLNVLKPGGYLLAFGGTRTYHRIACAIEDAGFEIRDSIMWIYGCLSEDTEILTEGGFKPYHKITKNDKIAIYDITKRVFKWEIPQRWQAYDVEQDTAYRIKSDSTDQIVSRNHRCIVEQNGKLVFKFAENLSEMERVPILPQDFCVKTAKRGEILQLSLCGEDENLVKTVCQQRKGQEKPQERVKNGKKPCLERGGDISQKEGELCLSKDKVCEMPKGVCDNGEKRWLCNGTQAGSGEGDRATIVKNRGCPSYKSQCGGQQNRKLNAIQEQPRPQEIRTQTEYTTTLATIEKIGYTGVLFCPTVSTGAFVARRNGKVFITGNSGFPKSTDIGLAIDRKNGVESEVVGEGRSGASSRAYQSAETTTAGEYQIKEAQNEWKGWKTALKPAYEPIIMARKPFKGSLVDNILENNIGGLNIDECRIPITSQTDAKEYHFNNNGNMRTTKEDGQKLGAYDGGWKVQKEERENPTGGRYPANLILTYDETDYDEVCGGFPNTKSVQAKGIKRQARNAGKVFDNKNCGLQNKEYDKDKVEGYTDNGSAARYFYCAKASTRDRNEGLDTKCSHPTVKPTNLMQYLIKLVAPKGATILDPFMGSGSTGKAVAYENLDRNMDYKFIGIEKDPEYCEIAKKRIGYVANQG